jgi:hypothetical protein
MSTISIRRGVVLLTWVALIAPAALADPGPLHLTLRSREKIAGADNLYDVVERPADWDPHKTAVIIVDMWDKHWCEGATRRVGEMAPRINDFVDALRDRGVFVIHAPSDTMKTYEGTPGRKLAQAAPPRPCRRAPPSSGTTSTRPRGEAAHRRLRRRLRLPAAVQDLHAPGRPSTPRSTSVTATRSATTAARSTTCSSSAGSTTSCLRRPLQHVRAGPELRHPPDDRLGKNVALVRDLTDTMYNPRMRPFVPTRAGPTWSSSTSRSTGARR